jgi:phage regulator Rha-like protein
MLQLATSKRGRGGRRKRPFAFTDHGTIMAAIVLQLLGYLPSFRHAKRVQVEHITRAILIVRGHKMLLDADLAAMYGVETKVLLQAVKRNLRRFPADFMIQLTAAEWVVLRSQIVTSKADRGGRRYAPYAFSEQGVAMLSSVLNSERAITVNIEIMRAFVRMRELLASNKELARQLKELETRVTRKLATHDQAITGILKAIRELMNPPEDKKRPIGFVELQEKK